MLCILLLLSGGLVGVEMRPSVQSLGTELTLGEVAEVRCEDQALAEQVRGLSLGNAPSPGFERVLTAQRLREAMLRAGLGEPQLGGSPSCRVRATEAKVPGAELLACAQGELRRALGADGDLELRALSAIPDAIVPQGDQPYSLVVRVDPQNLSTGSVSVPVQILVDGTPWRTVWTSWQIDRWTTVPVLRRAVNAGERLGPELFESQRVREQAGPANGLRTSQLNGAVARRALPIGSQVGTLDVERPQLVRPGDQLYLQIRKGGVVARVTASAREGAALGDRLRVITIENGQEMSGVLVARDLVEITLDGSK